MKLFKKKVLLVNLEIRNYNESVDKNIDYNHNRERDSQVSSRRRTVEKHSIPIKKRRKKAT